MRARMALFQSGVTFILREITLKNKPQDMLIASPKGTVPVLILPNGHVIDESLDIMRYALTQNDPDGWLNIDNLALIEQNDTLFKHHLDRYKYANRYPQDDSKSARSIALAILEQLNIILSKHTTLSGAQTTITDIAIFPFIRQFANIDKEDWARQPLPHLKTWLNTQLEGPLFQAIMEKYTPWEQGDPPIFINETP